MKFITHLMANPAFLMFFAVFLFVLSPIREHMTGLIKFPNQAIKWLLLCIIRLLSSHLTVLGRLLIVCPILINVGPSSSKACLSFPAVCLFSTSKAQVHSGFEM